uniref:V-type proton ATPase subunit C n=1 Tax=Globodera pallida TaxID=36090 RepID=A0A183BXM9_GLOPA
MRTYVTKFQWEAARYPVKQSLKALSELIGKQVSQIENDLKTKAASYNSLKNALSLIDRKTAGSLITRDLSDLTVCVVVPKLLAKEWESKYHTFAQMVVPGSAYKIVEDADHALYTVTLFQKVLDEFFVRDFVYDEQSLKAGKSERDKLVQEKQRQYAPPLVFCWAWKKGFEFVLF